LLVIGFTVCACNRAPKQPEEPAKQPARAAEAEHDYGAPKVEGASASADETKPNALIAVGAPIPKLSAVAQNGERVDLESFKGKPLVVYFYPKDDTPGCTIEAQEIRDLWSDIQGTGAAVIGVSVDDDASHKAFAEKYALPFLLLPDTDRRITQAFGVGLKSGRARRVTFVFDREGRVAKVFPEVTPKGHGREVVDAIKSLGG